MKETTIRFLMDDGASAYTFRPALSAEQYTELRAIVKEHRFSDKLVEALQDFAERSNLTLTIDAA